MLRGVTTVLVLARSAQSVPATSKCDPLFGHPNAQCRGVFEPRQGRQDQWDDVATWVRQTSPESFIDPRIHMAPGPYGQMTATSEPIEEGEVLMRLHPDIYLFHEDCFPSKEFAEIIPSFRASLEASIDYKWTEVDSFSQNVQLALCLLINQLLGERSRFYPYINTLPPHGSHSMFMWMNSTTELPLIRGTDTYRAAVGVINRYKSTVELLASQAVVPFQKKFPEAKLTNESFREKIINSLSLCVSRAFNFKTELMNYTSKNQMQLPTLVPLLDMLNHEDAVKLNCRYYFNTTGRFFTSQATKYIPAGSELIHSYGPRSNGELLMFYGFMLPSNADNFVMVADLTPGALNYNLHYNQHILVGCPENFFSPTQGSNTPQPFPKLKLSATGKELITQLRNTFRGLPFEKTSVFVSMLQLMRDPLNKKNTNLEKVLFDHGDFPVEKIWANRPLGADLASCELFETSSAYSVTEFISKLRQGGLPAVEAAGGCVLYSLSKKRYYRIVRANGDWTAWEDIPSTLEGEFRHRRVLIQKAGLENFHTKIFPSGMLPEMLTAVRLSVPMGLSSYAVHGILTGRSLPPELETQVSRTLALFCVSELKRRLRTLGVAVEGCDVLDIFVQSLGLLYGEMEPKTNIERLAWSEFQVVTGFCGRAFQNFNYEVYFT